MRHCFSRVMSYHVRVTESQKPDSSSARVRLCRCPFAVMLNARQSVTTSAASPRYDGDKGNRALSIPILPFGRCVGNSHGCHARCQGAKKQEALKRRLWSHSSLKEMEGLKSLGTDHSAQIANHWLMNSSITDQSPQHFLPDRPCHTVRVYGGVLEELLPGFSHPAPCAP